MIVGCPFSWWWRSFNDVCTRWFLLNVPWLLPFRTFLMHEMLLNVYIFQSLMSTASDSGAALITPSTLVVSHGMENMLSQEGICYSNSLLDLHRHRHWQNCYIIMGSDISLDGFSSCSHIEPVISVHVPCLQCHRHYLSLCWIDTVFFIYIFFTGTGVSAINLREAMFII